MTQAQQTANQSSYTYSGSTVFTPLTGTTVTIPATYYHYDAVITPAGSLAALTIALPATAQDGASITVIFNQPITAVTWSGATVTGAPAAVTLGAQVNLYWSTTASKWYAQLSNQAAPANIQIVPGYTKTFRNKVAQVLAGTAHAKVLILGDSNTAGFGAGQVPPQTESYTNGFALSMPNNISSAKLPIWSAKNQYCGAQWLGQGSSTLASYKAYDTRLSSTGSVTISNLGNLSGNCLSFTANAVGSFTFNMANAFDSYEVGFYSTAGYYVGTISANGSTVSNPTINGDQAAQIRTVTGTVAPRATSITITVPASGTALPILWIRTWDSAIPSIQIMQAGQAGGTIATTTATTNPYSSGNQIAAMGFDLVICHGNLLNDTGTAVDTWAASFATMKDQIRNSGADMAWTTSMNSQPDATNWAKYRALNAQGRTSSRMFNIPMLEVEYEWLPSSQYSQTGATSVFGWTGSAYDGRHPSGLGYAYIGNMVSRLIENLAGV
jgi:lysophospholipase L1-like esterase